MARRTTQGRIHSGNKITICGILFLYPKERWFIMIGPRLQKTQPGYNKGQNTITSNWRGNRQIEKEANYFNKLDLIWKYNNIRIKEGDEWKATFLTNKGLFEPQVMYFRLCNSPGTFQRMMNSIFWKLLHKEILVNYMDDFVIPAKTKEELEEWTIRFLKIAEKYNLCFK